MDGLDRVPILLDTDIGSDIDDAVCLAYLLKQKRCDLLGITTVTGQPEKRAMLVDMICRAAGRTDIPIHSGSSETLFLPQGQPGVPQAEILGSYPHRTEFEPFTAVEFLRKTIRERPGEITLLAIGPMTNIGLLFAMDPEIPRLLKRVVLMCGVFTSQIAGLPRREWNALVDPHATAIVYKAPVEILSIGLDVTLQCTMNAAECRGRFTGDVLEAVLSLAEVWFTRAEHVVFHDPLAAAVIFDPEICTYQTGKVDVELCSPQTQGMTQWTPGEGQLHQIAVGVDKERFFEHYFSVAS